MKKWLVLFLCAAALCGCGGDDDETPVPGGSQGGGGETQQPVLPSEILARRIASVDVTIPGDYYSCTCAFDYDGQGRLISIAENYQDASGSLWAETKSFAYEGNTVSVTEADGGVSNGDKTTYWVENGRAVRFRFEEYGGAYWEEAAYGYDAAGYLASLLFTFGDSDKETVYFTYTPQGCTLSWKGAEEDFTCTVEYDTARLNNLNLDLYGFDDIGEEMTEFTYESHLLGLAGPRWRYLPAKSTTVYTYEEDGKLYTDTDVISYVYRMDGEYLSEAEVYLNGTLEAQLVFHYE